MTVAEDGTTVRPGFYAPPTRALDRAIRQSADALSDRIASVGGSGKFVATVSNVLAGRAKGGTDIVILDWLGSLIVANGYSRSYTPITGHSVICDLIGDQVFVAYSVIGQP